MPLLFGLLAIFIKLLIICSRLSESVAFSRLSAFMKDQGMVSSFMTALLWSAYCSLMPRPWRSFRPRWSSWALFMGTVTLETGMEVKG